MHIDLVEESSVEIERMDLSEVDALEIVEYFGRFFNLEFPNPHHPGHYILRAKGHVGLFSLQGGSCIRIVPKVPCSTVWAMLVYAKKVSSLRWWQGEITCDTIEQIFEVFATELVQRVEARWHRGMCWDYEPCEDRGSPIRGRIIGPDYRNSWGVKFRYATGGPDCSDNQILLWTLYCMRSMPWSRELKMDIERIFHQLRADISLAPSCIQELGARKYNRRQSDYHAMHLLCRFLLEGIAPRIRQGPWPSMPFSIHMASLFEECISLWLVTTLAGLWKIERQWELGLEGSATLSFRIDLAVFDRDGGNPLAVIDTKYKLDHEPATGDIQQVVAYAVRLGVDTAILVYPHEEIRAVSLRIGDVAVFSIGLDLSADDWSSVGAALNEKVKLILTHKYNYVNIKRKY
jgi:5-methylcytosine-specific restriction enzyme subunit McrC